MLFEKINDKQIRCTIDSKDLDERGIDIKELAYGSEKARSLFQDVLHRASVELGFEYLTSPLMVEAIPLDNKGLMILIKKVDEPEELDTRFSRFSLAPIKELSSFLTNIENNKNFEANKDISELFAEEKQKIKEESHKDKTDKENKNEIIYRSFSFKDIDTIIKIAKFINEKHFGSSSLYKNPKNKLYYLVIGNENTNMKDFLFTCNILLEYGKKETYSKASLSHYLEHYEILNQNNVLKQFSKVKF